MLRIVGILVSAVAGIGLWTPLFMPVFASDKPNILFLHHSVGNSLIRDGSLRQILTEAGFDFWDHGYNHPEFGLRNEKGEPAGCYWIPDNNTNPDGLASLFSQDPKNENAFSKIIENHDVTVFKSCFPVSKIERDNKLKDIIDCKRRSIYNYKRHYTEIRKNVDKYQKKTFIIVTQPPLHPDLTNQEQAIRARSFTKWLKSAEYLAYRKNLFVFDLFDFLADRETNTLRSDYMIGKGEPNSHPNSIASMVIAPCFADFIYNIVQQKSNSNLPKITFDLPKRATDLMRLRSSTISLRGKVISSQPLRRLFWSDLLGRRGELAPAKSWTIDDLRVSHGVTKLIITAINKQGSRSSSVLGLQYYSGEPHRAIIFDGVLLHGKISKGLYLEEDPGLRKKCLVIRATGNHGRVAINGIGLDVSDFDPETTYLELQYDQGRDTTKPKLFISGIGSLRLNVDQKTGWERIVIPFNKFTYVYNTLNQLIIRGNWQKGSKPSISSIRLISGGYANISG